MPRPQLSLKLAIFHLITLSVCAGCGTGFKSIDIRSNIPASPPDSLVPEPSKILPNLTAINVKQPPFNATGDGVSDDTAAIQKTINTACSAGGGEIYFPTGTYIISPRRSSDKGALIIDCDNVTLIGDGKGLSILSRKTIGDSDPDTTCPMNNDLVNRGAGIYVTAKTTGDKIRRAVHLQQLSLLGNRKMYTGITGANQWPASQDNCFNVWDISDKGFYVQQDNNSSDITVEQSEIAYFSGELIYSGSLNSREWRVMNSDLHHSNGDAISVSAGLYAYGNKLHDLGANGIENQPYGQEEPQTIINNIVYNTQLDGIGVIIYDKNFYSVDPPQIEVTRNYIQNAKRFGILMLSKGGIIQSNEIYDSGVNLWTGCGIGLIGILDQESIQVPRNITVEKNTVEARSVSTQCGIQIYSPPAALIPAYSITISNNDIGPIQNLTTRAPHISTGLSIAPGAQDVSLIGNNIW